MHGGPIHSSKVARAIYIRVVMHFNVLDDAPRIALLIGRIVEKNDTLPTCFTSEEREMQEFGMLLMSGRLRRGR